MQEPAAPPKAVEIEPSGRAKAAVIFLHGLGSDGHELAAMVPAMGIAPAAGVRWILPHAASRPLAIAGGEPRTAWFDVGPEDIWRAQASDLAGLAKADALVRSLIEREIARGVPSNKIVVGGFSQGGALTAYVALRYEKPLAGAFTLSTFAARNVQLEAQSVSANRGLPVFSAHGTQDRIVAPARGRELRDRMRELGCDVTFREYPMDHGFCVEELVDLGQWIEARAR
ncbi:MAG: dienelactone hydrolase family protein [Planctomycetota bacterium]|nr:dienelactone hydrolase family protein [Planctomycetota bacterium]